jgi:hypothetical protein
MKKNRIERTIIKIFEDFEMGELPDDLEEWFEKYIPKRNRKKISNNNRCIANTHKRDRCVKKIHESSKCLCYQHFQIYSNNNILPFGLFDTTKEELLKLEIIKA